jgi:nitrogen fixation protein FixH
MSNVVELRPARGRWIPWTFVAGMLVVIAVNGVLITLALNTFPGLDDTAAYDHGVAYNAVVAEEQRQDQLGWRIAARLEPAAGSASDIVVRATRPDGTPLDGLTVVGELTRPLGAQATVDAALSPAGAGAYRTRVALRAGQWELHITATAGADRFDLRQRVIAR